MRRLVALVAVLLAGLAAAGPAAAASGDPRRPTWPTASSPTSEQASEGARLVAAEDDRLTEVRTLSSMARWQDDGSRPVYRWRTGSGSTTALPARATPYTVHDLTTLAPRSVLVTGPREYLLTEPLVLMPGAVLRMTAAGGLTLRLASGPRGFASITSLGGRLELLGDVGAPVLLTSWDVDAGEPDRDTSDGRAYLRAVGGRLTADHVVASDLGFWSGRTGGISLTGERTSATITSTTISRDAYGLFVSGASGVVVADTAVRDSIFAGVVLHRYVRNASLDRVRSNHNGGDGFTVDKGSSGIRVTDSHAGDNGGSGFTISGRPLATGVSPLGLSTQSYGDSSVVDSSATANRRYGIEVAGGDDVELRGNLVDGNDMGIRVDGPATRVSVRDNTVRRSVRHGIAVVDGVTASRVTGNIVRGAATGVYVRRSSARVVANTVQDAGTHGVALVGAVSGSTVTDNVLGGTGTSALDTARGTGDVAVARNASDDWHPSRPWYAFLGSLRHPMTVLWALIALLLVVSAVRARRSGRTPLADHPYAHQMAHQGHLPVPRPALGTAPVIDLRADPSRSVQR